MTKAVTAPNRAELERTNDQAASSPRRSEDTSGIEDKPGIARELKVCPRTIDNMMARRVIPFMRIGRIVRFDVARVKAALRRFEVCAAGNGKGGRE